MKIVVLDTANNPTCENTLYVRLVQDEDDVRLEARLEGGPWYWLTIITADREMKVPTGGPTSSTTALGLERVGGWK